jgi:site-specific DNA-methyltransferase (adenine-specific)
MRQAIQTKDRQREGESMNGVVMPEADIAQREDKRCVGEATLICRNALDAMRTLPDQSFDLAIVDPPYGAATTANWNLPQEHGLKGFGGEWKLNSNEWDLLSGETSFAFTFQWLREVQRLVRPTGSIWIHSTYHNAGFANVACQMLGLEIINEVIWFKRNSFPNLSARRLCASHESLLWVHTGGEKGRKYRFNYETTKAAYFPEDTIKQRDKQLRTVWDVPNNKTAEELRFGKHPTQKPLRLSERLFLISGVEGGSVLIPFLGSGTEAIAALRAKMKPTGFEVDQEYFDLAVSRVEHEISQQKAATFPLDFE